jgi:hypothetical protein
LGVFVGVSESFYGHKVAGLVFMNQMTFFCFFYERSSCIFVPDVGCGLQSNAATGSTAFTPSGSGPFMAGDLEIAAGAVN